MQQGSQLHAYTIQLYIQFLIIFSIIIHTFQFYSRNLKILKLFASFNSIHLEVVCIFFFVLYHFIYHFFNYFYIFLKKLHISIKSLDIYIYIYMYFYFTDIKFDKFLVNILTIIPDYVYYVYHILHLILYVMFSIFLSKLQKIT